MMDKTRMAPVVSADMQADIHFHTPGRLAQAFPYTAIVAGTGRARAGAEPVRKRFHQHVLIFTTDGRGRISLQKQRFIARPSTVAWLDTSLPYAHGCAAGCDEWRYLWMGIRGYGLHDVFDFLRVRNAPVFRPPDDDAARSAFITVNDQLRQRSGFTDSSTSAAIAGLIADLVESRQEQTGDVPEGGQERVAMVIREIRNAIARAWTVPDLAAAANLSVSQLHRVFKETVGTTPIDWIRHERINFAKQLLIEADTKVAAVALRCGYRDPYHFSRDFRRLTGYSPTRFRRDGGY